MICVTCWPGYNRITLRGHAHSGAYGNDAVCAAASVLTYTLAENLQLLVQQGKAHTPVVRLKPGNARISCRSGSAEAEALFAAIQTGFSLLARTCPQQVRLELR